MFLCSRAQSLTPAHARAHIKKGPSLEDGEDGLKRCTVSEWESREDLEVLLV